MKFKSIIAEHAAYVIAFWGMDFMYIQDVSDMFSRYIFNTYLRKFASFLMPSLTGRLKTWCAVLVKPNKMQRNNRMLDLFRSICITSEKQLAQIQSGVIIATYKLNDKLMP